MGRLANRALVEGFACAKPLRGPLLETEDLELVFQQAHNFPQIEELLPHPSHLDELPGRRVLGRADLILGVQPKQEDAGR